MSTPKKKAEKKGTALSVMGLAAGPRAVAVLSVAERAVLAVGHAHREKELVKLAASTTDIIEITNDAGYQQVRSARIRLKNERLAIKNDAEKAREDAKDFSTAVLAEQKRLIALTEPEELRLSALEDAHEEKERLAKQALIDAEVARQVALQKRVDDLRALPNGATLLTSAEVQARIDAARLIVVDESYEDKQETASAALVISIHALVGIHVERVAHEAAQAKLAADLADLERLRKDESTRKTQEPGRASEPTPSARCGDAFPDAGAGTETAAVVETTSIIEPTPKPAITNFDSPPSRDQIISALAQSFWVSSVAALHWLSQYDWRAEAQVEAA